MSILQEDMIDKVLSEESALLANPFAQHEVEQDLKQMRGKKFPGPNGLQAFFLQKYWNARGPKVMNMILGILNNGDNISAINDTRILLVHNIKHPSHIKDLRPINLCNVIYKLVSKVIVNRLRASMPYVVRDRHITFVENGLRTNNVIVAFEAFSL